MPPQNNITKINDFEKQILEEAKLRSNFSWRSLFGPIHQIPLLAIFLIAIFAPKDVLQSYPLAAWLASSVRYALLNIIYLADIKRFADSTDYPQVALLVCALHWAWLPVSVLINVLIFEYVRYREGYVFWRFSRGGDGSIQWKDLKAAIGSLLFPLGMLVLTMMPGDWSMTPDITTGSRFGMGLLFWIGFWFSMGAFSLIYDLIRIFFDINLRGK